MDTKVGDPAHNYCFSFFLPLHPPHPPHATAPTFGHHGRTRGQQRKGVS